MQDQVQVVTNPSRSDAGGVASHDFACSPYSYDFVSFLANATEHGAQKVILVPGERGWSKLSKEQEQYRFTHLILPLAQADGWAGAYCGVYFAEGGPEILDTPDGAGRTQYRATWKGTLEVLLTVDAPSYPIAKAIFKLQITEG